MSIETSDLNWNDWFYYDITSPTCLRWKTEVRSGVDKQRVMRLRDDVAGSVKKNGKASQVQLNGKAYFVHRIIWEMINGKITNDFVIDHIDGNPQNNNKDNLRLVSQHVNMRSQKKPSNNTSGVVGVSLLQTKGLQYWVASWRDLYGKLRQKCFSVEKYGYTKAMTEAIAFRDSAIEKLNEQGAGYSERHGK